MFFTSNFFGEQVLHYAKTLVPYWKMSYCARHFQFLRGQVPKSAHGISTADGKSVSSFENHKIIFSVVGTFGHLTIKYLIQTYSEIGYGVRSLLEKWVLGEWGG